jgi:hypothetical protein
VRAFVFNGGNVSLTATAATLARAVPRIVRICSSQSAPFIYHIGEAGKPRRMA